MYVLWGGIENIQPIEDKYLALKQKHIRGLQRDECLWCNIEE